MTALVKTPKFSKSEMNISVHEQDESERIRELRKRIGHCVCRYCGHTLSLRRITYDAYDESRIELYCEQCGRIEYGVEKEIYQVSEYFVDELSYDHFPNIDNSLRKKRMNVAVICDIIAWGFKNTGLLDQEGFKVPLDLSAGVFGEATYVSDTQLQQAEAEGE